MQLSVPLLTALYKEHVTLVSAGMASASFVSLTFDGWSRTQGADHLLGFCVATWGACYFLDFVATGGNSCTAEYLKEQYEFIVAKHHLEGKVTAVITDTPAVMRKSWSLLAAAYPQLQCLGCWMHILNLSMEDLVKESSWIDELISNCTDITHFFKRQQLNHAVLAKYRQLHNIKKDLDEAGETRFSFCYNVVASIIANRPALEAAVGSDDFNTGPSTASRARSTRIQGYIEEPGWWDQVAFLRRVLEPYKVAITAVQSDYCTQGEAEHIAENVARPNSHALCFVLALQVMPSTS